MNNAKLTHHRWRGAQGRTPAQWGGGVDAGAGGGRQGPRVRGGGALYLQDVSTTELMDQITIKIPNSKCRLNWYLIEFIDWRYSQSSDPSSLVNYLPLPSL